MNFYEYLAPKEVAAYWTSKANERQPYFGESKFDTKKKLGLDLSWIKGQSKAPVQMLPSSFDAKVLYWDRGDFQVQSTEIPYFKTAYRVDERLRQQLLSVSESQSELGKTILRNVFADQIHGLENAALTREVLRMQLLTTGIISIVGNGVNFTYDYGVPVDHKVTPKVAWDDASANVIQDLLDWQLLVSEESGVTPTELLLNSSTFAKLAENTGIRNSIYVLANGTVTPTPSDIKRFIYDQTGITVYVYDKGYRNHSTNKFERFVPTGTAVLMPEMLLGTMWFGTTPEEADLLYKSSVDTAIVDVGVAITRYIDNDPIGITHKFSQLTLPSFEASDNIIIASVFGG